MPPTAIYLQKACLQHRYIRTRDNSHIVERPERLRAVNIGLAAAVARLEERAPETTAAPTESSTDTTSKVEEDADELTKALGQLQLSTPSRSEQLARVPATFVHSGASVDILNNAAVKFVHGDIERDVYLENLKRWANESQDKVNKGESEIPEGYSQGDLYCKCNVPHSRMHQSDRLRSMPWIPGCDSGRDRNGLRGCGCDPRELASLFVEK